MSAKTIPLFSKRTFNFTDLQNGASQTIVIAKAIDVSQYTSGTLEVRLHSNSTTSSSAHIYVRAYTTRPSVEDPSSDFYTSATVASVDITNQSAPLLVVDALSAGFGGMLRITIEAQQAGSAVTLSADLSASLTLKPTADGR